MQKQTATIVSAELSGFQSLAENLTPEEISPLMKELHSLVENTARLHQGEINRFTGDAFLVAFQSKTAAKNALDSAFELKDQVNSFTGEKNLHLPFKLKFGIATGGVIITDIGDEQEQQTLLGEAVNHATRISQFADEGQILADEKTLEGLINDFELQKLEPIPLKGGAETLPIFELTGKKRKKLDLKSRGERKIISEMVGRSSEAEQLEGLIKNLADGKGTIVNIVGKAGIGKSRLMAELKVQPIMEKVLLLEGRAVSTGQNLSFHPITNLIKNWAGITEDDIPSVSSEKLFEGIKRNTAEQADEIYSFIATMMGLPLEGKYKERVKGIEGEALEKLILKNLRDLIIAATKDKPRIYMIEDAHWADSSSITLFESLYKLSQNYPVMFINVMRPGYKETGDYILKYLVDHFPGDHTTININPLEEKESTNLIKNLLREAQLPENIHKMIIRKTQGNPFFIEEIIRSFIDEGIVEVKDGHFIITEKINDVNIPETINEAILSRVDKLDEKTRELLNTASVMGRNFYYKVLEEATDTIEELDERLAYLTEVQLITETKKKQEIEYLFKHALAQQLTYDAMMQQSKKETHNKIAHSIEKVFAQNINEYYGTLAYHYTRAENQEKTVHYLILAGDESMKSGASSEALNFYNEAMALFPINRKQEANDEEFMNLSIKIAIAKHSIGKNEEAVRDFEMLLKKHFNDRILENDMIMTVNGIISMLIMIFMVNNRSLFFKNKMYHGFDLKMKLVLLWGNALITFDPKVFALKTAPRIRKISHYDFWNSPMALSVFISSASLFNWTGLSFRTSQKMLDLSQKAGIENNPNSLITFRMMQQMQRYYTGKWKLDEKYKRVYETGVRQGKFWETGIYTLYTGMICLENKDDKIFENVSRELEELADNFDNSHARAQRFRFLALAYIKFREFEKLRGIIDEGIAYIKTTGHEAMLLVLYCLKAHLYVYLNKMEIAEKVLGEAENLVNKHKGVPVYYVQYLLAKIKSDFEKLKNTPKSDENCKFILKELKKNSNKLISQSKKVVGNLTEAYLLRSRIFFIQQKFQKAFKNLQLAIATGEKYNGRLELSRACFETGKFLSNPNVKYNELNGNPASYYLEKAKTMFEEMDLQWDLEEYRHHSKSRA